MAAGTRVATLGGGGGWGGGGEGSPWWHRAAMAGTVAQWWCNGARLWSLAKKGEGAGDTERLKQHKEHINW